MRRAGPNTWDPALLAESLSGRTTACAQVAVAGQAGRRAAGPSATMYDARY